MKKILFLDMYGVIVKESKGYFVPYTYEHFEKPEHDRIWHAFKVEKLFNKTQMGEITSEEFLSRLGYPNPKETMKDYLTKYITLDEQFKEFAGAVQPEYELFLLSNDVLEWSEFLTGYHNINEYFSGKFISGEIKRRKPDKEFFSYVLEKLGCAPEQCIFVDNSVKNLEAAAELMIHPILFNRDNEEYDGEIVNDFATLYELLHKNLRFQSV